MLDSLSESFDLDMTSLEKLFSMLNTWTVREKLVVFMSLRLQLISIGTVNFHCTQKIVLLNPMLAMFGPKLGTGRHFIVQVFVFCSACVEERLYILCSFMTLQLMHLSSS